MDTFSVTSSQELDVRGVIQRAYTPYYGDGGFLVGPTQRTLALWSKVSALVNVERERGVLDVEERVPSSITAYGPGYVDRALEQVVGLQTDAPLKRALMPYGGVRTVQGALEAFGRELDPTLAEFFTKHRKTHNQGVFDAYTPQILACRRSGIITGLPDAYGRGRIIGDYRRVPLYGVDALLAEKLRALGASDASPMTEAVIREREELSEQCKALRELMELGTIYGFPVGRPARTAREAVQWLYLGYLAAIKEQDGAAMSLGRVSTFLDIYFERDLAAGLLTEEDAQELVDHFVMKLRMVRFLRHPDYNALFSGDPTWVTECLAGIGEDGRPLVTKTTYRFLQTLRNLGPAPEPNLTVLWSARLPAAFKRFCAEISRETSSIQYENDELMRPYHGDDYGIACCVSAMRIGKQMQFFGARVNLAKTLLYAINGGRDEITGEQVGLRLPPLEGDVLDYAVVSERFGLMQDWLAKEYVNALNIIHYMHDKYAYERIEMALHDREVARTMACGVAGLSVVADSLSAIKHATVRPVRRDDGLIVDYTIEGEFPAFGNNDDRVDALARGVVQDFMRRLRAQYTYRAATPTQSVLTITSNVVYGKKTGNTPDGRRIGQPFAPGANPMHGRDVLGALASLESVAKLPYEDAQDGISYTFCIVPQALGHRPAEADDNLVSLLDGYTTHGGHHINVNVLRPETLRDAMEHPEKYPQLTVRVSGYAVNFVNLTREQQLEVIGRTFHGRV